MLDAILDHKRAELRARYATTSPHEIRARARPTDRSLAAALSAPGSRFILECKRAAPSTGPLRADLSLGEVARAYAPFAAAISVLTDARYFAGELDHLAALRERVTQPLLCKDFILYPLQVYEARAHGADAVLLMLSALDDAAYRDCHAAAEALGMDVLTEVHDEAELARAATLGARIIGINNRDLKTLAVDLDVTRRLAPRVPPRALCVAESGIAGRADVRSLAALVDAFLVGSALMRAPRLDLAVRDLVVGRVKVCGLTSAAAARAAYAAGATYGGLNFCAASPRAVRPMEARWIVDAAPLAWVGVFADSPADAVLDTAIALGLAAVQLHGDETPAYCRALRARLPADCELWKAVQVRDRTPTPEELAADRVVLDAPHDVLRGGTGRRFDWGLFEPGAHRERYLIAGGLDAGCAAAAEALGAFALDVNSGVESSPGVKEPAMLAEFFATLRTGAHP